MHKATLLTALLMAILTTACGGGGGGGGSSSAGPSTFSGLYGVFGLAAETGPTAITTQFGSVTSDGVSQFSGLLDWNSNSVYSTGHASAFDYTVGSAGNLDWQFGLSGTVYSGGIASDGYVALVGTVFTGSSPAYQLLVRPSGTYSNASLNAIYHYVMQSYIAPNLASSVGLMDFMGNGDLQRSVAVSNVGGAVNTLPSWIGPGTYTVSPAGSFVADLGLGLSSVGVIRPGADVVMLAGATTNGQAPLLMTMIRQAASASNATFAGDYWAVSLRSAGGGFLGEVASVTANGGGSGSISGWENNGTTVTPFAARAFTYSVLGDGRLDLVGGTTAYRGAVSADGRFAMLGGSTTPGQEPTFYFLMRK